MERDLDYGFGFFETYILKTLLSRINEEGGEKKKSGIKKGGSR